MQFDNLSNIFPSNKNPNPAAAFYPTICLLVPGEKTLPTQLTLPATRRWTQPLQSVTCNTKSLPVTSGSNSWPNQYPGV